MIASNFYLGVLRPIVAGGASGAITEAHDVVSMLTVAAITEAHDTVAGTGKPLPIYLRLYMASNGGGSTLYLTEVWVRTVADGTSILTSGTAVAASSGAGTPASNAIDGSLLAAWVSLPGDIPGWWGFTKTDGYSIEDIVEVGISNEAGSGLNRFPTSIALQWSWDNSTWTTVKTWTLVGAGGQSHYNFQIGNHLQIDYVNVSTAIGAYYTEYNLRFTEYTNGITQRRINLERNSGTYVYEALINAPGTGSMTCGFVLSVSNVNFMVGQDSTGYGIRWVSGGVPVKYNNNVQTAIPGAPSISAGTRVGWVFNASARTIDLYINGTSYGTLFTGIPGGFGCIPAIGMSDTGQDATFILGKKHALGYTYTGATQWDP